MKITKNQIEQWIGSDNLGVDDFLDLLTELINGTYPIEMFKDDVLDYIKQGEEE